MKKLEETEEKVIKYNKYQQGDVVMFQVDDETFKEYSKSGGTVIDYNTQSHTILYQHLVKLLVIYIRFT